MEPNSGSVKQHQQSRPSTGPIDPIKSTKLSSSLHSLSTTSYPVHIGQCGDEQQCQIKQLKNKNNDATHNNNNNNRDINQQPEKTNTNRDNLDKNHGNQAVGRQPLVAATAGSSDLFVDLGCSKSGDYNQDQQQLSHNQVDTKHGLDLNGSAKIKNLGVSHVKVPNSPPPTSSSSSSSSSSSLSIPSPTNSTSIPTPSQNSPSINPSTKSILTSPTKIPLTTSLFYPDTAPLQVWRPQVSAWLKRRHFAQFQQINRDAQPVAVYSSAAASSLERHWACEYVKMGQKAELEILKIGSLNAHGGDCGVDQDIIDRRMSNSGCGQHGTFYQSGYTGMGGGTTSIPGMSFSSECPKQQLSDYSALRRSFLGFSKREKVVGAVGAVGMEGEKYDSSSQPVDYEKSASRNTHGRHKGHEYSQGNYKYNNEHSNDLDYSRPSKKQRTKSISSTNHYSNSYTSNNSIEDIDIDIDDDNECNGGYGNRGYSNIDHASNINNPGFISQGFGNSGGGVVAAVPAYPNQSHKNVSNTTTNTKRKSSHPQHLQNGEEESVRSQRSRSANHNHSNSSHINTHNRAQSHTHSGSSSLGNRNGDYLNNSKSILLPNSGSGPNSLVPTGRRTSTAGLHDGNDNGDDNNEAVISSSSLRHQLAAPQPNQPGSQSNNTTQSAQFNRLNHSVDLVQPIQPADPNTQIVLQPPSPPTSPNSKKGIKSGHKSKSSATTATTFTNSIAATDSTTNSTTTSNSTTHSTPNPPFHAKRRCISCHSDQSPCWRPSWNVLAGQLCNSCGLRYKKTSARCLNSVCGRVPAKGEWLSIKNSAVRNEKTGKMEYKCFYCGGEVEVKRV